MTATLRVLSGGTGCTVQDAGRLGLRHQGIPAAGWLDAPLAHAANALVGNAPGSAGLELRGPGLQLRAEQGPVRVALGGAVKASLHSSDGRRWPLPAWRSATLADGDVLQISALQQPQMGGCAVLAVAGGIRVPSVLGSRATYARAAMGGLHGRMLRVGDALPLEATDPHTPERLSPTAWQWPLSSDSPPDGPPGLALRVVWGPQDDHFSAEARAEFLSQTWQATAEQDRMGWRLSGPALQHLSPAHADIASDGVCPGAIQVPANGQPIILGPDGQTVGGYPKIATVIRADWPRLAQAWPGRTLRFEVVSREAALQALRALQAQEAAWAASLQPCPPLGGLDEQALYIQNLISGVIFKD
ncbi:MAG: biotin-dependent carboxyltransferase family protein [Ideonella sp.]|nr:biotin-dependent carboxyltransferase family protein [Ideonella sp.]